VKKIIASEFVALDSVIEAPGGEPGHPLMVFPVVVGSRRRLFPETPHKTVMRLADRRAFSSGVVVHTYHPVRG
jgi:hypothetical protein